MPIAYDTLIIEDAYRLDILVEDMVIIEVKAVNEITDVHVSQCLTYLRFTKKRLGYILNINVTLMKRGIKRLVL